jgi:hypothetical protein
MAHKELLRDVKAEMPFNDQKVEGELTKCNHRGYNGNEVIITMKNSSQNIYEV